MESSDQHHSHSRFRINILPLLIIVLLIFVMFRLDVESLVNNPQLKKNISYIKTSVVSWWSEIGIPTDKSIFADFFKTENINPLGNIPKGADFFSNFAPINTNYGTNDMPPSNDIVPTHQ